MLSAAFRAARPSVLGMTASDGHVGRVKRPRHLDPPQYLSPSPPVPKPGPAVEKDPPAGEETKLDPVRYGDWEKKGIAVDF